MEKGSANSRSTEDGWSWATIMMDYLSISYSPVMTHDNQTDRAGHGCLFTNPITPQHNNTSEILSPLAIAHPSHSVEKEKKTGILNINSIYTTTTIDLVVQNLLPVVLHIRFDGTFIVLAR